MPLRINFTVTLVSLLSGFIASEVTAQTGNSVARLQEVVKRQAEKEPVFAGTKIVVEFPNFDPAEVEITVTDKLSLLPRNRLRTGSQIVRIGIFRDEQLRDKLVLRAVLRTFQSVLIAKQDLSRHVTLNSEDVTLVRRETTRLRQTAFSAFAEITGRRTRRYVQAGEILTDRMLEPIPVVERGEQVNMHFLKESLEIVMPGKARENGQVGDEIRVYCLETGKSFEAEIIDEKTVHISLL